MQITWNPNSSQLQRRCFYVCSCFPWFFLHPMMDCSGLDSKRGSSIKMTALLPTFNPRMEMLWELLSENIISVEIWEMTRTLILYLSRITWMLSTSGRLVLALPLRTSLWSLILVAQICGCLLPSAISRWVSSPKIVYKGLSSYYTLRVRRQTRQIMYFSYECRLPAIYIQSTSQAVQAPTAKMVCFCEHLLLS